jgi:hypothetical protein
MEPSVTGWQTVMNAIPVRRTRRGLLGSVPGEYSSPERLAGRSLEDIASAYGRPGWWLSDPATGGLTAGWPRKDIAMRFSADGRCTLLLRAGRDELELRWQMRILGDVRGRPKAQVVGRLGAPNARSVGHGHVLLQWQASGYHVALGMREF